MPLTLNPPSGSLRLKEGSVNRGGRALKSARLLLKSLAALIPLSVCGASHAESAPSEQYHGPGASPFSAKRALQTENPWIARAMQDDAFVIRQRLPYDRVDMPQANKPNQVGGGVELVGSERFINLIDLNWRQHPSGHYAAVIAYTVEQARALRIALSLEGFPKGLTVKFVDADPATAYPAASLDHAKASELLGRGLSVRWSPIIAGETLHIELNHPDILEAGFGDARIELPGMSYLYAEGPWGWTPAPGPAKSGALKAGGAGVVVPKAAVDSCAVDVSCPTPSITDTAKDFFSAATALITYTEGGRTFACTGHLLADRDAATSKPYLLTANHCVGSENVAASVVAYWDYRAPSCGGDIARRQSPTTHGSELLAASIQQDWTLLILGSERNPAVLPGHRTFLGWDAAPPLVGERLHHIGHSAVRPQSYASGHITSVGNNFVTYKNMLWVNWETGLTAGGSSGSVFVRLYEDGGIRARTGGLSGGVGHVCGSLGDDGYDGYGSSKYIAPFSLVFPHIRRYLILDGHDDIRGGATILDVGSGSAEAAGDIAPGDDVDYFRFTVPAGPDAIVTAYTTGDLDTVGRLEDGDGDRLAANSDAGDGSNFRMEATLPPGDYYVRVESYEGGTGAYRLHLEFSYPDGHGDTRGGATILDAGSGGAEATGDIAPGNDVDYFRFTVPAGPDAIVTAYTTGGLDTVGRLEDGAGARLAANDDGGDGSNFRIEATVPPGDYYVRIESYNGTGAYQLHLEYRYPDGHGDKGEATILDAGSGGAEAAGDIASGDDVDYFRFTVPAGPDAIVTAYTTGDLDTVGVLEDSAGNWLAANDEGGDGSNFRMAAALPPGDYYVRVESYRDGIGAYRLHLEFNHPDGHGDTRGGATILDAGSGGAEAAGDIAPGDDVDYFRFTIPDGPDAVVTAYTTGGLDTVGRLEDGAGAQLAEDDDGGDESNFRVEAALPPGDYYVRVESYEGGTGVYRLHLGYSYPDGHGGSRGGATILDAGSGGAEAAGDIASGDDVDYFRFTVPAGPDAIVTAYTTGDLDTVGRLEDGAGARLAANDDGGDEANFRMEATLPPGDHYVRVESYGGETGAYRLHLEFSYPDGHGGSRGGATILDAGDAEAAGDIAPGDDVDYFGFTIPAGPDAVVTAYTTGDLDTVGVLEDSDGNQLAENDNAGDGSNFRMAATLPPGDHYVRVESRGGGIGAYRLHLEYSYADGHGGSRGEATILDAGSGGAEAAGDIAPGDDVDYFRFTVPAGPDAIVTAYTTGGLDTVGRLEDGAGARLAEDDDAGDESNFRVEATLPPGDHYVRVESRGGGIGAYRLHLEFSYPDGHGGSRGGATILDAGSAEAEAAGDIAPGNDVDYFRFTVPAGPAAIVTAYTTGGLDTVGVLEDSDGNQLAENDNAGDGSNFRVEATLPPGDHYVRVESRGGGIGAYRLHLEYSYADGHGGSRGEATILDAGSGGAEAAGDIAPGDDVDYFGFTVPAGPDAVVTAYTTGGLDTVGRLEDSAGDRLSENDDGGDGSNFRMAATLPPGDHYVRVESSGGGIGAYRLHLELSYPDGHGGSRGEATLLDAGSGGAEAAGDIAPGDDVDYFRFTVPAGPDAIVTAYTTGGLDTVGRLEDGAGARLAEDDDAGDGSNFRVEATLPPGDHYVRVESSGDGIGAYRLHLELSYPDGHGGSRGEATLLDAGSGGAEAAGDIAPGDDVDYFRFTVPAGPDAIVTAYTTGGLDTVGRLEDGAGARLAEDDDAGDGSNFRVEATLPPGDHYVRVESSGDGIGAYRLHLELSYPDGHGDSRGEATLLDAGSGGAEAAGDIAPGNDIDYFRFTVPAGPDAIVTAYTTGGLDTVGRLEDGAGARLSANDDGGDGSNFRVEATLPPGDHYVRVESSGDGIGAYRLHLQFQRRNDPVEDVGGDATGGATIPDAGSGGTEAAGGIAPGNDIDDFGDTRGGATTLDAESGDAEAAGVIAPGDDIDYFRFTIPAGPGAVVTAYTTGGLDTVGRLEDGDGDRLSENDDGGDGSNFRMEATLPPGDYYVRVESRGGATGAYRLHLEFSHPDGHGDIRGGATILDAGSGGAEAAGDIAPGDDVDYFRFTIPADRPGAIVTAYATGGLDTVGRLEDGDGARLAANNDAGDGSNFRMEATLPPGDYYVRVESQGGGIGAYRLHLQFRHLPEDDHGHFRDGATILDAADGGAEAAGVIETGGDIDSFRFTVAAGPGAVVTAYATGGLDTVGVLEDSAGARLAANDDAGGESNFRMEAAVAPGDYYVRVESYGGGTGAYRLHLEVMPDTAGRQPRLPRSAMADFDGGGAPDILLRSKGGAWWRYGLDGGRIVSSGPVRAVSNTRWAPQSLADFDGDGKADLLIRNLDTGGWWLYLMDGNAVAAQGRVAMTGDRAWRPEAFTDTNGDGAADVILRHADSGRWWRYGLSGIGVIESGELEMPRDQEYRALAFRDFNGDGRTDAVLRHKRSGRWLLYALDGDEAIGSALLANRDLAWVPQAFEDFNGDGRADLLLRNLEAGSWWLYTLNGNAIETAGPVRATRDFGWRPVAFADLDGNGVADVILRHDDGAWWTYLMDGGRVVGGGRLSATRDRNWRPVAVEDFEAMAGRTCCCAAWRPGAGGCTG